MFNENDVMKFCVDYFDGDTMAASVLMSKYLQRSKSGELLEDGPDMLFDRIADEFARIESKYPKPISRDRIRELLDGFKTVIPQGSPLASIGNDQNVASLANCFVLPNMHDSYNSIVQNDLNIVNICKRRGGVGMDLSTLRPSGASVSNAAGSSTGAVSFAVRFSNAVKEVAQHGRRGAGMITMDCRHPDIMDFITMKRDTTAVTGANISVKWTDDFLERAWEPAGMLAVKRGNRIVFTDESSVKNWEKPRPTRMYTLRFPVDATEEEATFTREVDAGEIWAEAMKSNHMSAEPGSLFWSTIKKMSLSDCYRGYEVTSTNPCVPDSMWTNTDEGPKRVKELIGRKFTAVVNGDHYESSDKGFFHTGEKSVYEIRTDRGFTFQCTADHLVEVVVRDGLTRTTIWKNAEDLVDGDLISLQNHSSAPKWGDGTFDEGWLLGSLLGDGCLHDDYAILSYQGEYGEYMRRHASSLLRATCGGCEDMGTENHQTVKSVGLQQMAARVNFDSSKIIGDDIEKMGSSFSAGFLCGWFDADGTVLHGHNGSMALCLSSSILTNLQTAQRMLSRLGIMSTILQNRAPAGDRMTPDGHDGEKPHGCQAAHELHISKGSVTLFRDVIGFTQPDKVAALDEVINSCGSDPYQETYEAKMTGRVFIGTMPVYDATIDVVHKFDINGATLHNCSELPLSPAGSCMLMAVNLTSFVDDPFSPTASWNHDRFRSTVMDATRLMDDMVDLELEKIDAILSKVESDPEPLATKMAEINLWKNVRKSHTDLRRVGLGITGLGDAVAMMGLRYGNDSIEFIGEIMSAFKNASYSSSAILAGQRGAFDLYSEKFEENHPFIDGLSEETKSLIESNGRRNVTVNTCAPAGSISILARCTSGIEPVFMLSYERMVKMTKEDIDGGMKPVRVDSDGISWKSYTVFHKGYSDWKKSGSEINPYEGASAMELDWRERVAVQAEIQKHIDSSLSSTVNLPAETTVETVDTIYREAHRAGCKGITIYRDGCRQGVLIASSDETDDEGIVDASAPKRPKILPCDIHNSSIQGEKWILLAGIMDGRPYELFGGRRDALSIPHKFKSGWLIKNGRNDSGRRTYDLLFGSKDYNDADLVIRDVGDKFNKNIGSYTRIISAMLRHGIPLKFICEQLYKDSASDMFTFEKGCARVLSKYISDGEGTKGACESCGAEGTLQYRDGCVYCSQCGNGKCS